MNNVQDRLQARFASGNWQVVSSLSEADMLEGYRSGILIIEMASDQYGRGIYTVEVLSIRRLRRDLAGQQHIIIGTVSIQGLESAIGIRCEYSYHRDSTTTSRFLVFDPE
jgi:hypothetical protein